MPNFTPAFRPVAPFRPANVPPRPSRPRVVIQGPPPAPRPPRMTLDGLGHTAYHHVGGFTDSAGRVVGTAAMVAAAYHGYKRNKSVGWAVLWAIAAGFAPFVTTGIALAQGFGKAK